MDNKNIEELFNNLDIALKGLGKSDSSIEYAPHIRQEYANVLQQVDQLKYYLGYGKLLRNWGWYFE